MSDVTISREDLEALVANARRTLGAEHPLVRRGAMSLHPSAAPVLDLTPMLAEASNLDAAFAEFWSHYPRKAAKIAAAKKFRIVVQSGQATAEELIEGAKRWAAWTAEKATEPEFIRLPTTWLNQGSWADGPDAVPSGRQGRVQQNRQAIVSAASSPAPSFAERMAAASQRALGS